MSPDQPATTPARLLSHCASGSRKPESFPGELSAGSGPAWCCGHPTKGTHGLKGMQHLRPFSARSPLAAGSVSTTRYGVGSCQDARCSPGAEPGTLLSGPPSRWRGRRRRPQSQPWRGRWRGPCRAAPSLPLLKKMIKVLITHMRPRPDASCPGTCRSREQREGR